jgi:propionyl-CoA synthetase
MGDYRSVYHQSLSDPDAFWATAAEDIHWYKKWDKVLDASNAPFYLWFAGGELNTCYNAVDYHVDNGRGDQLAIIYDSPVTDTQRTITYGELRDLVATFAGVLRDQGVSKGDRVIIYMPMIPEAAIAMLACARLGAIHSVVFGGFAANELATRIDDAKPKAIVSASCGIEPGRVIAYKPLLDGAIDIASHKPAKCVILARPQANAELQAGRDVDWHKAAAAASPADCVPVVGWVVGHSYIVYGPLLKGCTTVIYEGKPVGTPDPGAFWRVINEHDVGVLFTAPTAFRAIKKEDPAGDYLKKYDLSKFRMLFLAGERCDPDTLQWAQDMLKVPVIDHWWQTETGWAIAANVMGIDPAPVKAGSPTRAVPGYDVQVLNEAGEQVPPGDMGSIVIKLPMPPGCLPTLWNNDARFVDSYLSRYDGYYLTGDAGYIDADGYLWIMSRIDDVINVAGHRLSTGAMEEVLASHPDVAECAVIGAADALKGQLPLGLVVLKAGVNRSDDEIVPELVKLVRDRIGPVAAFKQAVIVKRLPKTRSGKVLRGTMRQIADGETYKAPATIDDPAILDEITGHLKELGYPRG